MNVLDKFLDNDENNDTTPQQDGEGVQQRVLGSGGGAQAETQLHASASQMPPPMTQPVLDIAQNTQCQPAPQDNLETSTHNGGRSEEEHEGEEGLSEEAKIHARSERKRHREKQRRSDVNSQFASLTALLRRIEAEDLESDSSDEDSDEGECANGNSGTDPNSSGVRKRKRGSLGILGFAQSSPANRVDLIARTIAILDRLYELNLKRRKDIRELRKSLKKFKGADLPGTHMYSNSLEKPMMNNMGMANSMNGMATMNPMGFMGNPMMNGMGFMMMAPTAMQQMTQGRQQMMQLQQQQQQQPSSETGGTSRNSSYSQVSTVEVLFKSISKHSNTRSIWTSNNQ